LALFSRLLSWLFANYHNLVVASLTGLMIGSLRKIWPWKETVETMINRHGVEVPIKQINVLPQIFDTQVMWAIVFCVLGILVVWMIDLVARKSGD
jgi:putative membrane protein